MGRVKWLAVSLSAVLSLNGTSAGTGAPFSAVLTETSAWSDGGSDFTQYAVTVQNRGPAADGWRVELSAPASLRVVQSWNCAVARTASGLTLTPADYNRTVPAGGEVRDIGLIVSGGRLRAEASPAAVEAPAETPAAVPARAAGKLHVAGTRLADEAGNAVQLRGVSTHGLAWYPQYVSEETFRTLRDDWGANTVRLAMYTAEYGGYCSGGDRAALKALLDKGVRAATRLGMYVIVDWHILSDGDPRAHQADAVAFFGEISAKYANYPNVIYEICNEPNNAPWDTAIRPYARAVLPVIRKNAPDAVVIVGTNTWSQDVDAVIGKRLDDPNVVYAFHFYAATHRESLRRKLTKALDAGLPCLVSECGISEASGGGGVDLQSAGAWLTLLNARGVSFVAWGLSNKAETVSLLRSDCAKTAGWTESDLTESGKWFRSAIKGEPA